MIRQLTDASNPNPRGIHTTEFLLVALATVVIALNNAGVFTLLPHKWATIMGGIVYAAYMISRGTAKKHLAP